MSIADELADLMHKRSSSLSVRDAVVIRRAVEALRRMERAGQWAERQRESIKHSGPPATSFDHGSDWACYCVLAELRGHARPGVAEGG